MSFLFSCCTKKQTFFYEKDQISKSFEKYPSTTLKQYETCATEINNPSFTETNRLPSPNNLQLAQSDWAFDPVAYSNQRKSKNQQNPEKSYSDFVREIYKISGNIQNIETREGKAANKLVQYYLEVLEYAKDQDRIYLNEYWNFEKLHKQFRDTIHTIINGSSSAEKQNNLVQQFKEQANSFELRSIKEMSSAMKEHQLKYNGEIQDFKDMFDPLSRTYKKERRIYLLSSQEQQQVIEKINPKQKEIDEKIKERNKIVEEIQRLQNQINARKIQINQLNQNNIKNLVQIKERIQRNNELLEQYTNQEKQINEENQREMERQKAEYQPQLDKARIKNYTISQQDMSIYFLICIEDVDHRNQAINEIHSLVSQEQNSKYTFFYLFPEQGQYSGKSELVLKRSLRNTQGWVIIKNIEVSDFTYSSMITALKTVLLREMNLFAGAIMLTKTLNLRARIDIDPFQDLLKETYHEIPLIFAEIIQNQPYFQELALNLYKQQSIKKGLEERSYFHSIRLDEFNTQFRQLLINSIESIIFSRKDVEEFKIMQEIEESKQNLEFETQNKLGNNNQLFQKYSEENINIENDTIHINNNYSMTFSKLNTAQAIENENSAKLQIKDTELQFIIQKLQREIDKLEAQSQELLKKMGPFQEVSKKFEMIGLTDEQIENLMDESKSFLMVFHDVLNQFERFSMIIKSCQQKMREIIDYIQKDSQIPQTISKEDCMDILDFSIGEPSQIPGNARREEYNFKKFFKMLAGVEMENKNEIIQVLSSQELSPKLITLLLSNSDFESASENLINELAIIKQIDDDKMDLEKMNQKVISIEQKCKGDNVKLTHSKFLKDDYSNRKSQLTQIKEKTIVAFKFLLKSLNNTYKENLFKFFQQKQSKHITNYLQPYFRKIKEL